MKRFLEIEDYTDIEIWSDLITRAILGLPSKPNGWEERKENNLPEGDWTLANGWHQMLTDQAYVNVGVTKPDFSQLPAMYCIEPDGTVKSQFNCTADQAAEFIRQNL